MSDGWTYTTAKCPACGGAIYARDTGDKWKAECRTSGCAHPYGAYGKSMGGAVAEVLSSYEVMSDIYETLAKAILWAGKAKADADDPVLDGLPQGDILWDIRTEAKR